LTFQQASIAPHDWFDSITEQNRKHERPRHWRDVGHERCGNQEFEDRCFVSGSQTNRKA
jgi:hypothetical protein